MMNSFSLPHTSSSMLGKFIHETEVTEFLSYFNGEKYTANELSSIRNVSLIVNKFSNGNSGLQ